MKTKTSLTLFILAFVFSLALNESNRFFLEGKFPPQTNGRSLVHNLTIWSIDNDWYLPQVENYFDGKGYTLDASNDYMKVRRTPGYSIFFGLHHFFFDSVSAFYWVRFTQILLFAFSTILLSKTAYYMTQNLQISKLTGYLYALSPFVSGYHYYTITEAIHPSFLIISTYLFMKAERNQNWKYYFFSGLCLGITTLIRPVDGLLLPFLGIIILYGIIKVEREIKKGFANGLIILLGFSTCLIPWITRNYIVTNGELVVLEKFYNDDPMSMGKGHVAFRSWWSCWENPASEQIMGEMQAAASSDKSALVWADQFTNNLPEYAFAGYEKSEVKEALLSYMQCNQYKKSNNIYRSLTPEETIPECEEIVQQHFFHLTQLYKKNNPFRYYILTPLTLAREFVLQSYSSMLGSLAPTASGYRWWQILIKGSMYLLNLILFISLAYLLFSKHTIKNKILLIGFSLSTMLFFIIIIRYVENRYMLQTYPFLYICLAAFLIDLSNKYSQKNKYLKS